MMNLFLYRNSDHMDLSINDTDFVLPKSLRPHNKSVIEKFDTSPKL